MLTEEMDDYKQPNGLPHAECRVMAETSDNREAVLGFRADSQAGKGLAVQASDSDQSIYMDD